MVFLIVIKINRRNQLIMSDNNSSIDLAPIAGGCALATVLVLGVKFAHESYKT